MTATFSLSMRQTLRRPWVLCVVCLCVLVVGYIAIVTNLTDAALHQSLRMDFARKLREVSFSRLDHPLVCRGIMVLADYLDPLIIETRSYDGEDAGCIGEAPATPELTLDVHHSSGLGGSLALPVESENPPPADGLTPEEARGLTPPRSGDPIGRSDSVWSGGHCFEDRPDLILLDSDSVRSTVDKTLQPFSVSIVDIRDEQDFPNASPSAQDQASVYTLRVACPGVLLDESHVLKLNCSDQSSDQDDKERTFATLRNRIVCQKDFPKLERRWDIFHSTVGIYR